MKSEMKKVMRKLASMLVLSLLVGCIAPAGTEKAYIVYGSDDITQGTSSVVQGDGVKAEFAVTGTWEGHCNLNVKLTNIGEHAMKNWSVSYAQEGEITQIWNAEIVEHTGMKYTIKNAGWNEKIEVGASVEFGYIIQGEDFSFPETIVYTGDKIIITETTPVQGAFLRVPGDGFVADFVVDSVWENHCAINVTLTNTGMKEMKDWVLSYEQKGVIAQIWNAEIAENDGTCYVIRNMEYNQRVPVGGSISFGYIVEGEDTELPTVVEYLGDYVENPDETPSPTPTVTPMPTATPEPTATPSPVPTETPTPTITPSPAPTAIPTPTVTPSPAPTATPTPTVTPSPAPTATPTPTVTPSPAPTETPTPTATPSPAPTETPTPTVTPEPTATPSPAPTETTTPSPTPTETPMPTTTPEPTATPSPAPTETPTPTAIPEPTAMPSPAPTAIPTPTVTSSPTPALTPVPIKKEIILEVTALNRDEVSLSWNSIEEGSAVSDVSGGTVYNESTIEYQIQVNGMTVECVSGSTVGYTYRYTVPDAYTTYNYQICAKGEMEEDIVYSNSVSFTNVKKVSGTISADTVWGENVGAYEVMSSLSVAKRITLRIKEGTVLRMAPTAYLNVYGNLLIEGIEGSEVVFTSLNDVEYGGVSGENSYWGGNVCKSRRIYRRRMCKVLKYERCI